MDFIGFRTHYRLFAEAHIWIFNGVKISKLDSYQRLLRNGYSQKKDLVQHAAGFNERHHVIEALQGFEVGHDKRLEPLGGGAHAGGI